MKMIRRYSCGRCGRLHVAMSDQDEMPLMVVVGLAEDQEWPKDHRTKLAIDSEVENVRRHLYCAAGVCDI